MSNLPKKTEVKENETVPLYIRFYIASCSGIGGICFSHPFDLTKSRMQVAGTHGRQVYDNWLHCMKDSMKEKYTHLYKGFGASCLRQTSYTGTRITLYTYFNDCYRMHTTQEPSIYANMMMGLIAGACGAYVGTPADLVLVRMITDGSLPPELRRNYTSTRNALARVVKEEGVRSLWRGCWPTIIRAMIINMTQFSSYSSSKRTFKAYMGLKEGFVLHTLSSFCSGIVMTTTSLPVDIAKTRLQNMKLIDGKPQYNGTFDVLTQLLRKEGARSLWKGYVPYFFRVVPGTMVVLLLAELQMQLYRKNILRLEGESKSSF